jgi:hypothetical protein
LLPKLVTFITASNALLGARWWQILLQNVLNQMLPTYRKQVLSWLMNPENGHELVSIFPTEIKYFKGTVISFASIF